MSAAFFSDDDGRGGKAPKPIAELLAKLLRDRGLDADVARAEVLALWPRLVGPQIAGVTQPRMMTDDGTLVVAVRSSAWMQELSLMERSLLAKINAAEPHTTVKKIRWEMMR